MDNKAEQLNEWGGFLQQQFEGCQVTLKTLTVSITELSHMKEWWLPSDKHDNNLPQLSTNDTKEVILLLTYGMSPSQTYNFASSLLIDIVNFNFTVDVEEMVSVALIIKELEELGKGR